MPHSARWSAWLNQRPGYEITLVYLLATLLTIGVHALKSLPTIGDLAHLGLACFFLYGALRLAQREDPYASRYGLSLGGILTPTQPPLKMRSRLFSVLREVGVVLLLAALIFPPYAFAYTQWFSPQQPFHWPSDKNWWMLALHHLIVVGLPEEAFFRGYLQTRLHDIWPSKRRILGVELNLAAWIIQALLFALIHVWEKSRILALLP